MTLNELNQFFDTYDKVESRIKEVAPLCTNITSSEEVTGFSNCGDGDICVRVWSQDCGNDAYFFPLKYLAMEDDEIAECEKKKEEKQRRLVEEEERKARKSLERQERREYKRLKKKYEGGFKKEDVGTCQYMWSHGCQMCDFNGRCAIQTLCIAKDEYDEYRKKKRRSKKEGEKTC